MKIIIFSPTSTRLTPTSIEDRPLGGADQALLRTIKALSEQHEIEAFIPIEKATGHEGVSYRPFQDLMMGEHDCDVIIHYRKCWAIPSGVNYKSALFYSQDDIDSPCFAGIPEDYFDMYDRVIVLSEYHAERIKERFKIKDRQIDIIGNGADERPIKEKEKKKFIYCSTPFRGLVVLVKMWKEIVKEHPDAELHVFSSMKIYDGEEHDRIYFQELYDKIQKIKGIKYHGSATQEEVLKCMETCTALLYPNTFPETYCNVLMEARACRVPFITSDNGALKETGGASGFYVSHDNPYHYKYQEEFIDLVNMFIDYPSVVEKLSMISYPIRTWEYHAKNIRVLLECVRMGFRLNNFRVSENNKKGEKQ